LTAGRASGCSSSRELEIAMPITPFLKNQAFNPELIRAMGMAFDSACRQLGLSTTQDGATEMVAAKIIQLAQQGENDPDRLCRRVLGEFNAVAANGKSSR
jgi:hypothetical protein